MAFAYLPRYSQQTETCFERCTVPPYAPQSRTRYQTIPKTPVCLTCADLSSSSLETFRSRRRGAPAHTPRVSTPLLQPLPRAHVELALKLRAGFLAVDEVAEAATDASFARVEAAARLAEVGHGGQLAVDGAPGVPAGVERVACLLRILLILEAHVHVADEVCGLLVRYSISMTVPLTVIVVVAYHNLLHQPVLAQLAPDVLVEGVKVHLHLLRVHLVLWVVRRVLIQVREENRLRVARLDMLSRAAVAVATGTDLVVKAAVDFVLLSTEDGGEVVGHCELIALVL